MLDDPGRECICLGSSTDPGAYMWALEWWPRALVEGDNPFVSEAIFVPEGANLARATLIPGAALALAPLTALAGPVAAYNLLALLSPVLAAFFCFLLCRRLTGAFGPSLAGGWLFGFSTYMLGQLTGHLNLTLVFLVPAIVHLTVRRLEGELGRGRYVGLLAAALAGQLLLSAEVLFTFALLSGLALAAGYGLGDPGWRARIAGLLAPVAVAGALAAVVTAPYLYYSVKGGGPPADPGRSLQTSADLLGFVFPTEITRLGRTYFESLSHSYTAGYVEGGAYLGLPLSAILLAFAIGHWRRVQARLLAGVLGAALVFSLGARMHVAGHVTVPLPWTAVDGLPLFDAVLPARMTVLVALCAALMAALWLAAPRSGPLRWAAFGLAAIALLPNLPGDYWRGRPPVPALFESDAWKRHIASDEVVLGLPLGIKGNAMQWQAQAGLGFRLAGGYIGEEIPEGYRDDPLLDRLRFNAPPPDAGAQLSGFLAEHEVAVVAVDERNPTPWPAVLDRLGYPRVRAGGALLWRVRPRR